MKSHFYSQLREGKSPADALSQSSKWLKTITHSELKMWYDKIIEKLSIDDPLLRPYLRNRIDKLDKIIEGGNNDIYFKGDYHWASFVITGK